MSSKREKIIIDCDAGIDDAQAIILALSLEVEVVAITCVAGNVGVDQVVTNVLRTLEVCERTDIPVYKGADRALLGQDFQPPGYHGEDGLGDVVDAKEPDLNMLQPRHAVTALIDLVKQNHGEITVAALGPLTNIALALRLDDGFSKNLKGMHIMGGNKHGIGNHFISAEFNFGADPEAAYVVLEECACPITIVSWEFCLDHPFEWAFFHKYIGIPRPKSQFLKSISTKIEEYEEGGPWMTCDPFAIATAVCPKIVLSQKTLHATIELGGKVTRGMMVVDWRNFLQKRKNVNLVEKVDLEKVKDLLLKSVQ